LLFVQGIQLRLNDLAPLCALLSLQLPQLLDPLLAFGFLRGLVLRINGQGKARQCQYGGDPQILLC
jgi:hypothetical protein